MMKWKTIVLTLVCMAGAAQRSVAADPFEVRIDAETGDIGGKRFYSRSHPVRILICRENPFAARYSVQVTQVGVTETDGTDLRGVLFPTSAAATATSATKTLSDHPDTSEMFNVFGFDGGGKGAAGLMPIGTSLDKIEAELQELRSGEIQFRKAQELAGRIADEIGGLDGKEALLRKLAASIQTAALAPGESSDVHRLVAGDGSDKLTSLADRIKALREFPDKLRDFAKRDECRQLKLIEPENFDARTVTVTVKKAVAKRDGTFDKESTLGDPVSIAMGQPLIAASVGMAWAPLAKTQYQSVGAASSTGGSASSTIALQQRSSSRVQPMVFVSANLYDNLFGRGFWCCSIHITAGFTVANNGLSTNPEFLIGPSLGLVKDRLFLTVGAYGGYRQSLAGPYSLGGAAPTGSIPTVNQFQWKQGWALSWRVPKLGGSSDTGNSKK